MIASYAFRMSWTSMTHIRILNSLRQKLATRIKTQRNKHLSPILLFPTLHHSHFDVLVVFLSVFNINNTSLPDPKMLFYTLCRSWKSKCRALDARLIVLAKNRWSLWQYFTVPLKVEFSFAKQKSFSKNDGSHFRKEIVLVKALYSKSLKNSDKYSFKKIRN